ncbi:hypothetical protein [Microvirga soli]|uniref:hypothetical protein n=1 Tax=Microvirga soli TaxID=1854496 RepID=UPI00191ECA1D|nr:hypothetical protein [Microvirga soli]
MSEWVDFERWKDCSQLQRPGYIFEVRNAEGQSLFTACDVPLKLPSGWTSAPVRFRLVEAPKPRHSAPIPKSQS